MLFRSRLSTVLVPNQFTPLAHEWPELPPSPKVTLQPPKSLPSMVDGDAVTVTTTDVIEIEMTDGPVATPNPDKGSSNEAISEDDDASAATVHRNNNNNITPDARTNARRGANRRNRRSKKKKNSPGLKLWKKQLILILQLPSIRLANSPLASISKSGRTRRLNPKRNLWTGLPIV